ncbi:MAG: DUF4855 domain-containing protein [Dysgonomonas sp.]
MKTNRNLSILWGIILLSVFIFSCSGNKKDKRESKIPSAKGVTDLALIYHTYTNRPKWTSGELKHYLYRENEGKIEWLFDGYLFLEIYATIDGINYDYGIANNDKIAPRKTEWQVLLDETFADKRGPDALEIVLDSLAQMGYTPPYKRQVMFCIPNPQYGQTNWGNVNGQALDFNKPEDRLTAAGWYIDRVLEEWEKKDYQYLYFAGFYWLHETIDFQFGDDKLIKGVQDMLKEKNIDLCWIPYYGAEGADKWKDFGFNIAYQQPNYFFDPKSPMEIITGALDFAYNHNLSLEMEFDDRVEQPVYRERFYTYVDEFTKADVWNNKPVAYYQGSDAWLKMSVSKDPEMQKMVKTLGDILVKRNGKFSVIDK